MSDYRILVSARPAFIQDDQTLPHALLIISCHVNCFHIESDVRGGNSPACFADDDCTFSFQFEHLCGPFASEDCSPSSLSWAIVSSMLDDMRFPFVLDRLWWLDESMGKERRLTRDEVVSEIARVAGRVVDDPWNDERRRMKMAVDITKRVGVSGHEICRMREGRRRLELWNLHSTMLAVEESGRRIPARDWEFVFDLMRREGVTASPDHNSELDGLRRRVERESRDVLAKVDMKAAHESMMRSLRRLVFEL
ncbi:hypothetical protein NL676_020892 [Syzygium grande]|nr:hypothetical protein NL676_020892 [Syzygium grande]